MTFIIFRFQSKLEIYHEVHLPFVLGRVWNLVDMYDTITVLLYVVVLKHTFSWLIKQSFYEFSSIYQIIFIHFPCNDLGILV
jgi:hypothetical protein